jgi:hypothetical protein
MPGTTSNSPWIRLSCAWRHRLGLTVGGASPEIPDDATVGPGDQHLVECRDEPSSGVDEVLGVRERQSHGHGLLVRGGVIGDRHGPNPTDDPPGPSVDDQDTGTRGAAGATGSSNQNVDPTPTVDCTP